MLKQPKVFCIGFHKTGTSSLRRALQMLGYTVAGFDQFRHLAQRPGLTRAEVVALATTTARDFDAVQDMPWPVLFAELDQAFPGSKFIHVVREPTSWIKSAVGDFGNQGNELRRFVYGSPAPVGHEQAWLDRYHQHNADVAAYFADRPQDFLSLRLENGGVSWAAICPFLGAAIPDAPWPHTNTRRSKKTRQFLMRMVGWLLPVKRR